MSRMSSHGNDTPCHLRDRDADYSKHIFFPFNFLSSSQNNFDPAPWYISAHSSWEQEKEALRSRLPQASTSVFDSYITLRTYPQWAVQRRINADTDVRLKGKESIKELELTG